MSEDRDDVPVVPPDDLEPEDVPVAGGRLDLNSASAAELQDLPGVGPALAEEIVAYRAEVGGFREPAEVTRVPGVSEETYALFADRVTAGGGEAEEELVVEEGVILPREAIVEPLPPEIEPVSRPEDLAEEEALVAEEEIAPLEAGETPPPPPPPPPGRAMIREVRPPERRGVGWGSLLFVGLVSALIGALLALLVLYGLNGTLQLRRVAAQRIQGEVFRLEGDIGSMRGEVDAVQSRVAELGDLAGRMDEAQGQVRDLGRAVDTLGTELNTASQRLDDVQTTLAGLSDDMTNVEETVTTLDTRLVELDQQVVAMGEVLADVQAAVTRFDAFFTGLRQLLDETMESSGEPQPVGPVQTATPGPGATPAPTATPRANVTVIPLATPTP